MAHWIEAEAVPDLLQEGMTVFIAGVTAEPTEILQALSERGDKAAGVRFIAVSVPGTNCFDFASLHPQAMTTVFFATPENRKSVAAGKVDFIPLQYRAIYDYLENDLPIDIAIAQLPPINKVATVSHGVSVDFLPAVLDKAKIVVGEMNARQPVAENAPHFPASRLTYAVACDRQVKRVADAPITDTAREIGRHVAELISDGDCIQIGIGAIPAAVLSALAEKNDLGFHSGMITGSVMELIQFGNMNGVKKNIDNGKAVTGVTLGDEKLANWAGTTAAVSFRPVNYTHDICTIRNIDNFVSINSALEVDLFGQVNSDMLHGCQVSGTGGAIEMMRAAALSKGGRSIIALNATAERGQVSRIVPRLATTTATTALRTDVDYVVTEYGARRIRHLPLSARLEALIEIAHPNFRDWLREEWQTPSPATTAGR